MGLSPPGAPVYPWHSYLRRSCLPLARSRSVHSSCTSLSPSEQSSQFVVCGAGAGGLAVASRLGRRFGEGKVIIVDPAEVWEVPLYSHNYNNIILPPPSTKYSSTIINHCGH